ncbi:MAG: spore germination protein [Firmicutes bacterium]|nr:spore germination protein [Bacillota bacterium]
MAGQHYPTRQSMLQPAGSQQSQQEARHAREQMKTSGVDLLDSIVLQKIALEADAVNRSIDTVLAKRTPYFAEEISYNLRVIRTLFGESNDIVVRELELPMKEPVRAALIYLSSLVKREDINNFILRPLMDKKHFPPALSLEMLYQHLHAHLLPDGDFRTVSHVAEAVHHLLEGEALLLVDTINRGILIGVEAPKGRSVEPPNIESAVLGPQAGFTEQIQTNFSLMRQYLHSSDLRVVTMEIGRTALTKVAICYIDGLTNTDLIAEVRRRLAMIEIDGIWDAGMIEQFLEDNHVSPFPQVQLSERPDKTAANLLEGRVAVFVDGSPFSLIVPGVFTQFYQASEDYNERWPMATFIRFSRAVALFFSLVTPSLYVALTEFNQELIPANFAVAVASGRVGVPFPAVIEVFAMEVVVEVLREATLRMPQRLGQAISIVGVLVIGQSAISAGFASPIVVVVVALTTVGSFAAPSYQAAMALRMLRFPLLLISAIFGLYGTMIGLLLIFNHLLSLKSFGVPFLSPVVPPHPKEWLDTVVQRPLWLRDTRPKELKAEDQKRLGVDPATIWSNPTNVLEPHGYLSRRGLKHLVTARRATRGGQSGERT